MVDVDLKKIHQLKYKVHNFSIVSLRQRKAKVKIMVGLFLFCILDKIIYLFHTK